MIMVKVPTPDYDPTAWINPTEVAQVVGIVGLEDNPPENAPRCVVVLRGHRIDDGIPCTDSVEGAASQIAHHAKGITLVGEDDWEAIAP